MITTGNISVEASRRQQHAPTSLFLFVHIPVKCSHAVCIGALLERAKTCTSQSCHTLAIHKFHAL